MRRALAGFLVAASLAAVVPARAATHLVTLSNGRFNPPTLEIAVGDTVQWLVQENGHTITASDYRFDFEPTRSLRTGETREWTFTEDETVRYICRVHAPAMTGVITVGEGSPPPPPPPPISGESRRVPTATYPTIEAALAELPPDSEIVLDPGTYQPFRIEVDELLVRGATAAETTLPGRAVIDGNGIAKTGIEIDGDDVTIRDLEIVEIADDAIVVDGDDAVIEFVAIHSGYASAIRGTAVARTRISGVEIAGSPGAPAISFDEPDALLIEDVTVTSAETGVRVRGGNGIVVRRSTLTGTGTGLALRGDVAAPITGLDIRSNTITQTVAPIGPPDGTEIVTGAGIWLDHALSARIEGNAIARTLTYGIATTGLVGPSLGIRSIGNVISDAVIATEAWDGLGTACTDAPGATDPPTLAATNRCGEPLPGAIYPKVGVELAAFALLGQAIRDSL